MIIPFYEKIVNHNKYGNFDMEVRDKFTGVLTPDGKPFKMGQYGHGFDPAGIMIGCWLDLRRFMSKEDLIENIKGTRDFVSGWSHRDKQFLLDVLNYGIAYYQQYYELDSPFMKTYMDLGREGATDYLVQLLDYDKVERLPKTITTSKVNVNEAFFNYLIMDFTIAQVPKVKFDEKIGDFNFIYPNDFIQYDSEKGYDEEVKLIKKYIPLDERQKYFR